MSGGESLRRMPASGTGLQRTVKIQGKESIQSLKTHRWHGKPVPAGGSGTGRGSAGRGRHGTDHRDGRPVEIPQQSAVPDRPRKRRKTDGGILCRTDPLPDPGTGAGLPAWMCGK